VHDLVERVGATQQNVSKHLATLQRQVDELAQLVGGATR
jgi:hypothetical protein